MSRPSSSLFELRAGPHDSDSVKVVRFKGTEKVSKLFSFSVTIAASAEQGRFSEEVLGAPARLTLHSEDGDLRRIQGITRKVKLVATDGPTGTSWYKLKIVPRLWLLSKRINNRIFQDISVPDIVKTMLNEVSIEHELRLDRPYQERPYCVQYQESDLDFIERLLAEEGIYYYFEDPPPDSGLKTSSKLICGDMAHAYSNIEGDPTIPYRGQLDMREEEAAAKSFGLAESVCSDSTLLRYFDFKRPLVDFSQRASVGGTSQAAVPLEKYSYLYDLEEAEIDPDAAVLQLEQQRAQMRVGVGQSRCRRLCPGRRFELTEHPITKLCEKPWVVTMVEHRGVEPQAPHPTERAHDSDESYVNCFSCVPADIAVRPPFPSRQIQQVTETATVVGPAGEEIFTDEHGRIKVQFHWDREGKRDEHSSCWMRVLQPWAGPAWGFQFIPRVGMEVVVTFSGGDTDRPIVLGCLSNGMSPPPLPLPGSKTQSGIRTQSTPGGGGANEMIFEDAAGSERIYLHAQRDLDEVVENEHTRRVLANETVGVDGVRLTTVGGDHIRNVVGNEVVSIEKNLIIQVAGRHILHIDGSPIAPPSSELSRDSKVAEVIAGLSEPLEMTAEPLAQMAVDQSLEDDAIGLLIHKASDTMSAASAKFIWQLSQLPRELLPKATTLESQLAELRSMVGKRLERASDLRHMCLFLHRRAARGVGRWIDLGGVYDIRDRALALRTETAALTNNLIEQIARLRSPTEPAMAKLHSAASDSLHELAVQLEMIDEGIQTLVDQTGRLHQLTLDSTPLSPALQEDTGDAEATITGEATGGGGMGGVSTPRQLRFENVPSVAANTGEDFTTRPLGSIVDITNGGQVISLDGFKIDSQDCHIEMLDGCVTIKGKRIRLAADEVEVNGTKVNMKGAPIKLN